MKTCLIVGCALLIAGCCCNDKSGGGGTNSGTTGAAAAESPTTVPVSELLSDYKANEIRADQKYKGKLIRTSGSVGHIAKSLGTLQVSVGTGAAFEIPAATCMVVSGEENKAAALSKGDRVTIRGKCSGLVMNVVLTSCHIE